LIWIIVFMAGCAAGSQGSAAASLAPYVMPAGYYQPKITNGKLNECHNINGQWVCNEQATTFVSDCAAAPWLTGVFTIADQSTGLGPLGDTTFQLSGSHLTWEPQGVAFTAYPIGNNEMVIDVDSVPGKCAIVYDYQ
jgi:hypothetical protein